MCNHITNKQITNKQVRVLAIGPGRAVRGGITAVLLAYEKSDIWTKYHCEWLETYDDVSNWRKIRAALRALFLAPKLMFNSDIVHIHTASRTSFYRKTVFFLLAKLLRKKLIIHLHGGNIAPFFCWPLSLFSRAVFTSADCIIALSEAWAGEIRKIAPNAKITVMPNPCSVPNPKIQNNGRIDPAILFAGILNEKKGFCDLIRAMPMILSKVPNAKLLFAGDGDIERGKTLARRLGIDSSVQFLGWLKGSQKVEVFAQASVFCLPSYAEGVPMAMLEAMAYRVALVVTPVGGIPDVISHRENGLLVDPGDITAIAEAIIELISNQKLSEEISQAAYNTVVNHFSIDTVCKSLSQIYDAFDRKQ